MNGQQKTTPTPINERDLRVIHNKLRGGWFIAKGDNFPMSKHFKSKAEAIKHLQREVLAEK